MICPRCKAVYRVGFLECFDCQIPLVEALPIEEQVKYLDESDPVIVYATGNPVLLSLAKSMLEEAEIEFSAGGEEVQFLLGAGGSGVGFNPTTGPVKISVMPGDANRAAQVLDQIDEQALQEEGWEEEADQVDEDAS